jgi:antitoxin VapB
MALSIRNPRVEELARRIAMEQGESVTEAILKALEARADSLSGEAGISRLSRDLERIRAAGERCAAMPERDGRSADEILGYDERGLPA